MKNQKEKFNSLLVSVIILALIMVTSACGKTSDTDQTQVSKVSQTSPKVDIYAAALTGDLDAIRQHIKAGTDLNKKDAYGSTPLVIAITFGKKDVAIALIEAGADVNLLNNDGSTPLHSAVFFCRKEVVQSLLDHEVDKSVVNNYGSTALQSIEVPFRDVKPIYDQLSRDLGPLGLKLDYVRIESTRPQIAEMLR